MNEKHDLNTYVTNKQYDITGQKISRIGKHYLISRLSKYENLAGGPGWKSTLFLYGLHYFTRFFGKEMTLMEKVTGKYLNR